MPYSAHGKEAPNAVGPLDDRENIPRHPTPPPRRHFWSDLHRHDDPRMEVSLGPFVAEQRTSE